MKKHPILNYSKLLLFGIIIAHLHACAPSRLVKPLAKNEQAIGATLGGPLMLYGGGAIPTPLTSVFYAKGLTDKTSAFASLHTTSLLFGVFQTDIGICHTLLNSEDNKTGLSVNPALNFAVDRWEWNTRIWPQLDVNLHHETPEGHLYYAGLCNWFETNPTKPHEQTQAQYWIYCPQIGVQFKKGQWNFGIESKWIAPTNKNQPTVVDYIGIQHQGAIGAYFQIMRRF